MIKIQDLLEGTRKSLDGSKRGAVSVVVVSINHSYKVFAARFTTRLRLVVVSFFSSFLLAQAYFKSLFNFIYRNSQFDVALMNAACKYYPCNGTATKIVLSTKGQQKAKLSGEWKRHQNHETRMTYHIASMFD